MAIGDRIKKLISEDEADAKVYDVIEIRYNGKKGIARVMETNGHKVNFQSVRTVSLDREAQNSMTDIEIEDGIVVMTFIRTEVFVQKVGTTLMVSAPSPIAKQ